MKVPKAGARGALAFHIGKFYLIITPTKAINLRFRRGFYTLA